MKRILITGTNSYLGNAIEQYLMEYNSTQGRELYRVDKLSLREEVWKKASFAEYDTILHVAGIAHADIGNVSKETQDLYYRINCGLTLEVAEKAKAEGVPQFVYFSSVIVYGEGGGFGKEKVITAGTQPQPANFYGDSKWQAEIGLSKLGDDKLKVAVLRLPMIYGKGSKGNFPLLVKIAKKLPFFPKINNRRSMLYVENLAEFVRLLTECGRGGTFFPQNAEYVTTARMVKSIGQVCGKNIHILGILNPLVTLASHMPGKIRGMVDKAFGSLIIDKELSLRDIQDYQIFSLEKSIGKSLTKD